MHLGKSQWPGCPKSPPSLILLFVLAEETVFICLIDFGLVWLHCRRSNTGAYTRQARTLPLGAVPSPFCPLRRSPFRQVMWTGDRTADWPIRGSLWWGESSRGQGQNCAEWLYSRRAQKEPLPSGSWLLQYSASSLSWCECEVSPTGSCVCVPGFQLGDAAWERCEIF